VIQQLRIYQLYAATAEAFHTRFRDHAVRIFARHGIVIRQAWTTEHDGVPEFAYLIEWPDQATMQAAWTAFSADEEWQQIKRDTAAVHGPMLAAISDRTLESVEFR